MEFIPLWGFLVFLLYRMRRVECRNCGMVVEEVPGVMVSTVRCRRVRGRLGTGASHVGVDSGYWCG
jgi:hypothetical protein